jgi:murein DD-endopeptidase MepM/ murein hydrolase activator NlpD
MKGPFSTMRKFLIPVMIVLLWTMPSGQGARSTAPSASELREQLDSIAREKVAVQSRLRVVKKQQKAVTLQLNAAERQLDRTRHRLSQVSQQLEISQGKLTEARKELAASEASVERHGRALSERLELIYQRGEAGLLEVLFQASSYADLQNRLYLLDQFMLQDAVLLEEYEEAQRQKAEAVKKASENAKQVECLRERAEETHSQAAQERRDTAALKQRVLQERMLWERALAELEQNSKEVEALLRRLQQTQGGRERLSRRFTEGFIRPASGRVSSGFGYRIHPIFRVRKMHTGVDIAAAHGAAIHAAAGGLVVHSGRWGGYGQCVIIDHGGGVATLYAHCSRLLVPAGEEVTQGQVIGRVGSTGLATGPHLHFEVRRNGQPVDPGVY